MTYFAIAHTYGANMRRGDNRRMGLMVEFDTQDARDKWCLQGQPFRTHPRFREAVEANDSDVSYFRRANGIVQEADLSDPRLADWA